MIEQAYSWLFTGVVILLALCALAAIVRSILGPAIADRVISVNAIGTITVMIIAVLTVLMDESYLADVCLIYAIISFLAVVVLCKIYIGVYLEHKRHRDAKREEEQKQ